MRYAILDSKAGTVAPRTPAQPGGTPEATPAAKPDATAKITGLDLSAEPIVVTAQIDPFDPAAANPLAELHVVVMPAATPLPGDPSTLLGASFPTQGYNVAGQAPATDVSFSLANVNPTDQPLAATILLVGGYEG